MRHGKKINHLSRTAEHRAALLSNMASSLIMHKRINTTVAKAKALRRYVEPLITKAKDNTTHSRRVVFSYLQNKDAVKELFGDVAGKIADRPGGYTRIFKTGNRLGDNAEMALIELVDYNEFMTTKADKKGAGKTRRSRRGTGKAKTDAETTAAAPKTKKQPVEEAKSEESATAVNDQVTDIAADNQPEETKE